MSTVANDDVVNEPNRWRLETPGHAGWPRTARPGAANKYFMVSADCHANPLARSRRRADAHALHLAHTALLRQHGYRIPSGSAENFIARVQNLSLPGRLLSVIAPPLTLLRPLHRQLVYSDATIEHLAV